MTTIIDEPQTGTRSPPAVPPTSRTPVLLSGQMIGPGRTLSLSPADATGETWWVNNSPDAPTGPGTVGLVRVHGHSAARQRPRRAWGYLPAPQLPSGWEVVSTGLGAGALGQALAGLLAAARRRNIIAQ